MPFQIIEGLLSAAPCGVRLETAPPDADALAPRVLPAEEGDECRYIVRTGTFFTGGGAERPQPSAVPAGAENACGAQLCGAF